MAAVLGIVRGHSGAIKVYSEPGRGSTFKALFPCTSETPRERAVAGTETVDWVGSGTVLVVDDEESVRAVAKLSLEKAGFTVLTAIHGLEGVDVFRKHKDEITVVLLDMTMPHLSGEEAFSEMRRVRDDVKVLLSSGYNEQDATSRFAGKGLAGFIQKPYKPSALVKKIRHILEAE